MSTPEAEEAGWAPSTPAEELRLLHSWRESQVKALGRLVFVLGIFAGLDLISYALLASRAADGRVIAPWVFSDFFMIVLFLKGMIFVAAVASGYCLYTLRGSALALGAFALSATALLAILLIARDLSKGDYRSAAAALIAGAVYVLPSTLFLQKGMAIAFSPAYRAAIHETRNLRVKPRLPWSIKLGMLALIAVAIVVGLVP